MLIERLLKYRHFRLKEMEHERLLNELKEQRETEAMGECAALVMIDGKRALMCAGRAPGPGAVYCAGALYDEDHQGFERPMLRGALQLMVPLCGIGVKSVVVGPDSAICFALTDAGDVWSWGHAGARAPTSAEPL